MMTLKIESSTHFGQQKKLVEEILADTLGIIAWSCLCLHQGFFPSSPLAGLSFYRMEIQTLWPSFACRRYAHRSSRILGSLQKCFVDWRGGMIRIVVRDARLHPRT